MGWSLATPAFEVVPDPVPDPVPLPDSDSDDYTSKPIRRKSRNRDPDSFLDIITFRRMLTPILIQILFWVGSLLCSVIGGKMFLENIQDRNTPEKIETKAKFDPLTGGAFPRRDEGGIGDRSSAPSGSVPMGLAIMVFGPFLIRIWCELTIVLFSIHRELKIANDRRT